MRTYRPAFKTLTSSLLLLTLAFSLPTLADSIRPEVTAYHKAMTAAEKAPKRQAMEALFQKGTAAMDKVAPDIEAYAHKNWDSTDYNVEKQFASLMKLMKGFMISQYEGDAVIQGPNFAFWDKLAQAKGNPADVEFFKLAHKQYPEYPGFTSFIKMEWDYGGCTRYGEGHITPLYIGWMDFQKKYPNQYKTWTQSSLKEVRKQLEPDPKEPICSCSGKTGFIKEAQSLTGKRPQDPLTQKFIKLSKDPKLKFECHYG